MTEKNTTPVIDYEGSKYRTDFWEGKGRNYEDTVERTALRRLLPPQGKRLLELGAGFGRLTNEYAGYDQVVLLDYSHSLLQEAQAHLGREARFVYVAANIYELPLANGVCDAATMIRVLHHFADVPKAFQQIRAALAPGASFILEFANKRNLKAMARYAFGRQSWSPYSDEPIEYVELNFDFHPRYIYQALDAADFTTTRKLAVSYLRLGILKKTLPTRVLGAIDGVLQHTGAIGNFSPSVFTHNIAIGNTPSRLEGPLFKCPKCASTDLEETPDSMKCPDCGAVYLVRDGIYDFRKPIE
jgi:SAM-dependent methyltransferase